MLFQKDIFMCNISRDSDYVIGKKLDMSIGFGGNRSNTDFLKLFNRLRELGVVPLLSEYLETIIYKDKLDIVYFDIESSEDLTKDFIYFKKISIPSNIKSISELDSFVIEEIKRNITSKYSFKVEDLLVNATRVGRPKSDEINKGIKYLSCNDEKYSRFVKPSSSVYCQVNGVECILSVYENCIRDLELLPARFDSEYLICFWRIISLHSDEKIVEFLSAN